MSKVKKCKYWDMLLDTIPRSIHKSPSQKFYVHLNFMHEGYMSSPSQLPHFHLSSKAWCPLWTLQPLLCKFCSLVFLRHLILWTNMHCHFPSGSPTKTLYSFLSSTIHTTCSIRPTSLIYSTIIIATRQSYHEAMRRSNPPASFSFTQGQENSSTPHSYFTVFYLW